MSTLGGVFRRIFHRGGPDCSEVRKLGSDFLEDELSLQKRTAMQAHLDKCGPCRAFIETLSATIGILTRIPRTSPPHSFKEDILERIRQEDQDRH
jgi:predicted anti-sigma-YlaC factor YlaD